MLLRFCHNLCRLPLVGVIAALAFLATPALAQRTIRVPADQPTIQAGINAATDGDTVLVAPGTYPEVLDFNGKAITLTSSDGPAATLLSGGSSTSSTLNFSHNETQGTVVQGFTITNALGGGAASLRVASATIRNNIFRDNLCTVIVGASASPLIQNNTITGTHGGPACGSNSVAGISLNFPDSRQFAVAVPISANTIIDNSFSGPSGSAIALSALTASVVGNRILHNSGTGLGTALQGIGFPNFFIANNVIARNSSAGGGAVYLFSSFSRGSIANEFTNNTVVDNVQTLDPSAATQITIQGRGYGGQNGLLLANNIVRGASVNPLIDCADTYGFSNAYGPYGNSAMFSHNVVWNDAGPVFNAICKDPRHDSATLVAEPVFVDPLAGDYHMAAGSPGIDAGVNSVIAVAFERFNYRFDLDADGAPRVASSGSAAATIDAGAFERNGADTQPGTLLTISIPSTANNFVNRGDAVPLTIKASSASGVPQGMIRVVHNEGLAPPSATLDPAGQVVVQTPPLSAGVHSFVAFCDNCSPTASESAVQTILVVASKETSSFAVASSLNPAPVQTAVRLTARVSASSGTPTGTVTFDSMANQSGPVVVDTGGKAEFVLPTSLPRGTYAFTVRYSGDANYSVASATINQVITGSSSATTLTASATSVPANTPITLTAATTVPGGTAPDLTRVQILDGASPLAPLTVTGSGVLTTVTLAPGTHVLTASFAGDSSNEPSASAPVTVIVQGAPTTTTLTADPAQPTAFHGFFAVFTTTATAGTPRGNVTLTVDGNNASTGSIDGGPALTSKILLSLPAGSHTLIETYTPADATTLPSSAVLILNVARALVSLTVPTMPAPFPQSQPGTVTALFDDGTGRHLATGSITPVIDNTPQAATALTPTGQVSLLLQGLAAGAHTVSFTYPGDSNFLPATSATVPFTVLQRDFALKSDTAVTIPAGSYIVRSIDLTPIGGFTDAVTLSCENLPAAASCRFDRNPMPVTAGGSVSVHFALDTSTLPGYRQSASLSGPSTRPARALRLAGLFSPCAAFPCLLLLRSRRRAAAPALLLLLALAALSGVAGLAGCSGRLPAVTPTGTYTVRITGASPGITHSQAITVQVTSAE